MTEEEKEDLILELVELSRKSFGRTGHNYWLNFVNGLLSGGCESLPLNKLYRPSLNMGHLRQGLHRLLGVKEPLEKSKPELLNLYDSIIQFVRDNS